MSKQETRNFSISLQKSDEKSEKYRNAGNTMFSKSKLKESIRLYTEAILWATTGSEHLAMAFANRSAAHFDCGNFEAAITDIENALATGSYPKKLSYKLILRKGYSYKELLQLKKAEEAFVNAENLLEKSHLDEDRLIEVKGVIQEARKVLQQTKLESDTTTPKSNKELYKIDNPNASIPEFSDSLKVAFKERFGRHIVASEDISVGDILAVEEAAVWRLMPNPSLRRICCHCMQESLTPLPCNMCAAVSFCSKECQEKAWRSHHRWECAWSFTDLHQTKNGDDMACSSMFLAYRAMTLKNVDFFLENQALFEDHDLKFNVEGDDSKARITEYLDSEKTKYRKLFNLVTHDDEGDEDFHLKNAVITIFFLYLLEQNFWFEEHSSDGWSEEKKIIAKIINHFICVAKFNTHQTGQFDSFDLVTGYSATSIGQVIRPNMAMFNHSCDPNMVRVDRGKFVIAAACTDIKIGEEVRDSYGSTYFEEEMEDRREKLKNNFWFRCICEACKKRWPCREDLPCNMFEVRECQLKVARKETDVYAAIMDQYLGNIIKILRQEIMTQDGDMETSLKLWRQYHSILATVLTKPYLGYIKVMQGLRNSLWIAVGGKSLNFYEESQQLID